MASRELPTTHSVYIFVVISLLAVVISPAVGSQAAAPIAKPGCQAKCGGIPIPYPFGIGSTNAAKCFHNTWFELTCQTQYKTHPPKLFLSRLGLEVLNISIGQSGPISLSVGVTPYKTCTTQNATTKYRSLDLRGSPYRFSDFLNVFVMEGCSGTSLLRNRTQGIIGGCSTICDKGILTSSYYDGVSRCQSVVNLWAAESSTLNRHDYYNYDGDIVRHDHESLDYYEVEIRKQPFNSQGGGCFFATLINIHSVSRFFGGLSSLPTVPVSMEVAFNAIGPHQDCFNSECYCTYGSEGNPYMTNGCEVAEACRGCKGECYEQRNGEYHCPFKHLSFAAILGLSIGTGVVLLAICFYWLYRLVKWRREMNKRKKNFKRNGGLLLQQQLSSNEGALGRTKVFSTKELEKATDNFNNDRILGQGGQGTVYKGMLTDGRIVAIKKSKLVDESQIEQFINELVILSQINHRNVVKLLGCCLETEVPLLVYEFISNGTLSQHIHDSDDEDFHLSWEMRLKVAYESASAIAYLHSSSSPPIYHRDIKTSNILLDDKNRAKVSDFGSSKTIALDQTHLTTVVQGTMGYLDPEYFQSYQFTEKSDVYSFGVVLLELLTNRSPFYRGVLLEQKNLVTEFFSVMETSSSSLIEFLDPVVVQESKRDDVVAVARLAKRCLNSSGRMRPKMKEVAAALEMIIESPSTHIVEPEIELLLNEGESKNLNASAGEQVKKLLESNSYQSRVSASFSIQEEPLLFSTM